MKKLKHGQTIAQAMAADKALIEEYLKSGDESKRPKHIKFVMPFALLNLCNSTN